MLANSLHVATIVGPRDTQLLARRKKEQIQAAVNVEIKWASERKSVVGKRSVGDGAAGSPAYHSLTDSEQQRLSGYLRSLQRPFAICDLGQNPESKLGGLHSIARNDKECLHTLTAGTGLVWGNKKARWLVVEELFMSMGHAITPEQIRLYAGAVSHFSPYNENKHCVAAFRTRASAIQQCGNAMHVHSLAVVSLITLLLAHDVGRLHGNSKQSCAFRNALEKLKTRKRKLAAERSL